jgi:predicted RNA polymerase sigma factor
VRALVEHFFRHEFGRLCAVLTRSLGVRRLAHDEDVIQAALVQALEIWSRRGVPEDPAGWLYRTARNLAIDTLRQERTHASRGYFSLQYCGGDLPTRRMTRG